MMQWNQVIFAQASMMEGKSVKLSVLAVFALYNGNTANTVYFGIEKKRKCERDGSNNKFRFICTIRDAY